MWNLLAAGLTALLIFGAGLFLLVRPEKIQKFYLDFYARHAAMAYQDPLSGWLKTRSYILCFRAAGLILVLVSSFALIAFVLALLQG